MSSTTDVGLITLKIQFARMISVFNMLKCDAVLIKRLHCLVQDQSRKMLLMNKRKKTPQKTLSQKMSNLLGYPGLLECCCLTDKWRAKVLGAYCTHFLDPHDQLKPMNERLQIPNNYARAVIGMFVQLRRFLDWMCEHWSNIVAPSKQKTCYYA